MRDRLAPLDAVPGSGDKAAFELFFASHYGTALGLSRLLLGDPDAAEDLVCETFARLYPRWQRGRVRDLDAYLRRALVNGAKNRWRGRARAARVDERLRALAPVSRSEGRRPLDDQLAVRDEVMTALRALPVGQRQVVVLRYYADASEAETAALLGVRVGTVKSQAASGLAKLQKLLEAT